MTLSERQTQGGLFQKRNGLLSHALRYPKTTAFLCALLVAAAFIVPAVIAGGGIFYVSNDQITQQLPFTQQIVKNLHSGSFAYDFTLDLGSGLIEGYAWYNLSSVFSLVLLLFPYTVTPYLLGPMLALKFGFAGLFSFMWLRRHTKTDLAALCGSLCYAFCGMAITNMVFPFQDVYTLFPLLPLAMDELMDGGRAGWLALAVAANILANPPLFFGTAVFMALYFGVKSLYRAWNLTLKVFVRLSAAALCGVALSGFILLPFVASLAANPRVGGVLRFGRDWFIYVAYRYFEIFRAMVLPPEVMHQNSMFLLFDAVSPEGYLPLFGLVLAFAFVLARKRHWVAGLLFASLFCAFVPVLNSAFNAFNATYYTRWFYMPVLVAALATALFLEDTPIPLKPGYIVWGGFAALLCLSIVLWRTLFQYQGVITSTPAFVANLVIGAAGLGATLFARRLWQNRPRALVALVALFAIATGGLNLAFNHAEAKNAFGPLRDIKTNQLQAGQTVPLPDGVYRINSPIANQFFGHGSPFSFNSTVSSGIFQLQAAFGRQRTSASVIEYSEPGLWALLGVQYLLVPPGQTDAPLPNTRFYAEGTPYSVVENLDALPLVVGFDRWMAKADADPLDNTQKSIAMLHGLVLDDTAPGQLPGLAQIGGDALGALAYQDGVAARRAMAASKVLLQKNGLSATITMENPGALLITLPFDEGWRCTINGENAPLVRASYGLTAVACPAGVLKLTMHYRPVGSSAGLALTAAGLIGLGLLLWRDKKRKKETKKAAEW